MKPAADIAHIDGSIGSLGDFPVALDKPRTRLAAFIEITKPRMNVMVAATTMFGFFIASKGPTHWPLLICTLVGTMFSASAASVFNQLIERNFDAQMPRTRNRPLPLGEVGALEALAFGIVLAAAGLTILFRFVNPLTTLLSAITIAWYLLLYTPSKRLTSLNTVVGAVPGAIPPMMGFSAATGHLSPSAFAVFGIMFVWQIPHFLAIAIMYRDDYSAGGFKMLPCDDHLLAVTRRQIILYCLALIPTSLMPTMLGTAGQFYAGAAVLLGLVFLRAGWQCSKLSRDQVRNRAVARRLFFTSIIYLPLLLMAMAIDRV